MLMSKEELRLLVDLHDFLRRSFARSTIGGLDMTAARVALWRAIVELGGAPKDGKDCEHG